MKHMLVQSFFGTERMPPSARRSPVMIMSYPFCTEWASCFLQQSQHRLDTRKGMGFSLMKSSRYLDEPMTSWISGRGSPLELQPQRKLIWLSHLGYRCRSSSRLAVLSSAFMYSSAMVRGMCFFWTPSSPAEMILEIKGSPYSRVARTMFFFGRYSGMLTPYFFSMSPLCRLMASISRPVLKKQ